MAVRETEKREELTNEKKAVICHDVLGYMWERQQAGRAITLEMAYELKGVPVEMQMTIEEIVDFLYPNGFNDD